MLTSVFAGPIYALVVMKRTATYPPTGQEIDWCIAVFVAPVMVDIASDNDNQPN